MEKWEIRVQPMGLQKETLDSLCLRIPLINTRNKKDKTLDSLRILISL